MVVAIGVILTAAGFLMLLCCMWVWSYMAKTGKHSAHDPRPLATMIVAFPAFVGFFILVNGMVLLLHSGVFTP